MHTSIVISIPKDIYVDQNIDERIFYVDIKIDICGC